MKGDRERKLLHVGFGTWVVASKVVAIVTPNSLPIKKFIKEARAQGKVIDSTHGRKTRSIVVTESDHLILSAIQSETLAQRFSGEELPFRGELKSESQDQEG